MTALVKAAKKEGHVNVITIPLAGWANYGLIMKDFTKKYGIKINDANPNGSSAEEITAINQDKGARTNRTSSTSERVMHVELRTVGSLQGRDLELDPSASKDSNGRWFDDYGGYVAIGCDTKIVTTCPTSFADLTNPMYKNEVAINNDPTSASAAFYAVWAAAIANGGSYSNIEPGITFFANLNKIGNFVPGGTAQTAASGATPILICGTTCKTVSLRASWLEVSDPNRRNDRGLLHPGDHQERSGPGSCAPLGGVPVLVARTEPVPAGVRRPIELPGMIANKTVNQGFLAKLPAAPKGALTFPTRRKSPRPEPLLTPTGLARSAAAKS